MNWTMLICRKLSRRIWKQNSPNWENAEEIKRHFHAASSQLQDGEINVLDSLKQVHTSLQNGVRYLPSSESLVDRLQSTLIELKDLSAEVEQVADSVMMDEERG
ncbi:hypothetical protein [Sphingobacterium daejeonense]|uniref:hypothetical protein n=1 Tax=Sphingobacterium daejeonense TaxID=371142 RepID=UPI0010C5B3FF|nr:hypothetical protein [Sphingobacterium daejeonense]VTQ00843.1 Uncharacterised protein [Sphingobacterium daejeonense]